MKRKPRMRIVISLAAARSSLARFVSGSFAVHGVLVVVALVIPAARHRHPPIDDTMVVALAGPLMQASAPAAGPPAPAQAPPAAKPAPTPPAPPKEAHTAREVPVTKPKKKAETPKKAPEKAPEPQPPEKPSPPGPPGTGSTVPQGTNPAPGQGAVSASIGGGDSSLGWYGAAVKAALEAAWQKPFLEDAAGTASVVVQFEIARDGAARDFRIVQSSGIQSLDRSAQRAVVEASPLPPIPPSWTEATVPVTMRFDLTPEAR